MPLFPDIPGHEFCLMKIPPRKGMRGVIDYTDNTGPGVPPEDTEVEVVGPSEDANQVTVRAVADGAEYSLGHWHVDCGEVLFLGGQWRRMDDPLVVEWQRWRAG